MELVSGLVTIVLLVLVPGLASGQSLAALWRRSTSSGSLDGARSRSSHCDQRTEVPGSLYVDCGPVSGVSIEARFGQFRQEALSVAARAPTRHRWRNLTPTDYGWSTTFGAKPLP